MDNKSVYILVAIIALAAIAIIVFVFRPVKKPRPLSPIASIAFACVLAGILFSEEPWLGYGLFGLGIILAVIDIIIKSRAKTGNGE